MTLEKTAEGAWLKIKGAIKKEWADLTDDDIMRIEGSKDKLIGTLISRYNMTKDEAERRADKIWSD